MPMIFLSYLLSPAASLPARQATSVVLAECQSMLVSASLMRRVYGADLIR